ncbi:acyltransferase family protein [Aurantiacibacter poecillastricola]|uniref:acyltransferase family protein n=1 Tax=Aurantiacibacter poecillastricola TaxID=3064385 RepID=UPI00273DA7D0|nr:acyltransferase [Aurantiacibacter sp. 219JJ12-13]MDP5260741.1 acyltransferase [Aurantiacibacter sp. 219JJ12-13]
MIAPPIPPQRERTPHLAALTGLRGIAAWMVVLYHARLSLTEWMSEAGLAIAGKGYLAVDLFFMLSGFVMWLNYGERLRREGAAGAPAFWWRRLARIWPLHGAILLAMVCFALVLLATGRDMANYPLAELPLHVLLLQNWGLTSELSWNHPAWSISAEMGAYLMFPLAVVAVRWERMGPVMLATGIVACAFVLHGIFAVAGAQNLGHQIPRLGLVRCIVEFGMGMMLANLWQHWRNRRGAALVVALAAGLAFTGLLLPGMQETLVVPLGFALLLLALALDSGLASRLLSARPLVWLGDTSYATYLAHFPLLLAIKIVAVDESLQIGPLLFAAYVLVLLALSGGLYRWLEKPAQNWLNGLALFPHAHPGARPR